MLNNSFVTWNVSETVFENYSDISQIVGSFFVQLLRKHINKDQFWCHCLPNPNNPVVIFRLPTFATFRLLLIEDAVIIQVIMIIYHVFYLNNNVIHWETEFIFYLLRPSKTGRARMAQWVGKPNNSKPITNMAWVRSTCSRKW